MKPETKILYTKYSDFLMILSNERNDLFFKNTTELDYDKFFEVYNYVIYLHWEINTMWKKFNRNRSRLIKKFEYEKYMILLRRYFCYDIRTVIIAFIL